MRRIFSHIVTICSIVLLGASCTSVPLQQKYATQFAQLKLGETTRAEVQKLFPKAFTGGQQVSKSGINIDAMVLKESQYDITVDNFVGQQIYFYFADDKLVQWGRPQDWKDRDPDVVIQDQRNRDVIGNTNQSDMYSELMKLKQLKDEGLISEEEFQQEKKEILDKY